MTSSAGVTRALPKKFEIPALAMTVSRWVILWFDLSVLTRSEASVGDAASSLRRINLVFSPFGRPSKLADDEELMSRIAPMTT